MKSFSHRFISNPQLAWVIAIVISLCGALCLSRMPVSEYPNIILVPLAVMLSTVVSIAGAFYGLWLTGTPLSIYAQLGCGSGRCR